MAAPAAIVDRRRDYGADQRKTHRDRTVPSKRLPAPTIGYLEADKPQEDF